MLAGDKNLKNLTTDTSISLKDTLLFISYTKTNKLITALYMVTDIIEREEPIRNKLRTLGLEILSDTSTTSRSILDVGKIDQIVSLLNIASAMSFISEMNCAILTKELLELKRSIQEHTNNKSSWLEGFLENSPLEGWPKAGVDKSIPPPPKGYSSRGESNPKGHTRIGVQKGSTLMKALSDRVGVMSDRNGATSHVQSFDLLKKERRFNIVKIIKENGGSASIKDVKDKINIGMERSLVCSEKTIQRELVSMTKDGVLNKTGEKRWSRYSIK